MNKTEEFVTNPCYSELDGRGRSSGRGVVDNIGNSYNSGCGEGYSDGRGSDDGIGYGYGTCLENGKGYACGANSIDSYKN